LGERNIHVRFINFGSLLRDYLRLLGSFVTSLVRLLPLKLPLPTQIVANLAHLNWRGGSLLRLSVGSDYPGTADSRR